MPMTISRLTEEVGPVHELLTAVSQSCESCAFIYPFTQKIWVFFIIDSLVSPFLSLLSCMALEYSCKLKEISVSCYFGNSLLDF